MLIPIKTLTKLWKIKPNGVLHVGAHNAEESYVYNKYGWGKVIWVEAQETLARNLQANLDLKMNKVLQIAAWSEDGIELTFNLASNGQSSSLFELGTHLQNYPKISIINTYKVRTNRLDTVLSAEDKFSFVNIDVQGAELEVLKGLGRYLSTTYWVYTEVNKEEVYKDCAKVEQIDDFLAKNGFSRVSTRWVPFRGWGDALYVRTEIKVPLRIKVMARTLDFFWTIVLLAKALIRKSVSTLS